jgi:hypothetical protein
MSGSENYLQDKQAFLELVEKASTQLREAQRETTVAEAREVLQIAFDATNELLSYLESPVLDQAIETFYSSSDERAKAAVDLNRYLADAGLDLSDRANWQLHDNNWCVDGQISYHEGRHVHSVSAHYDSHTGWGWGVC